MLVIDVDGEKPASRAAPLTIDLTEETIVAVTDISHESRPTTAIDSASRSDDSLSSQPHRRVQSDTRSRSVNTGMENNKKLSSK